MFWELIGKSGEWAFLALCLIVIVAQCVLHYARRKRNEGLQKRMEMVLGMLGGYDPTRQ
jgi:ABC-type Fe3+ transport system permease subunit